MAESNEDSFQGRARESVTGWWGRSRRFLSEVRNEMGRVTWPSQKEVYATTIVVILFSVTMGIYLWGVDQILESGRRKRPRNEASSKRGAGGNRGDAAAPGANRRSRRLTWQRRRWPSPTKTHFRGGHARA